MSQYRTAQGKTLDMSAFVARNDKVRAVGNMKVNARGDTIDSEGRVVQSVNDKINQYYSDTVTNPGALGKGIAPSIPKITADAPQQKSPQKTEPPKPQLEEMSAVERELEESLEQSLDEEIVLEQQKKQAEQAQQESQSTKQSKTKK